MKIQILSDIHNEFYRDGKAPSIEDSDSDVVVLAGDIDTGTSGVQWANEESDRLHKPIIYVAGNHEYYHREFHANLIGMKKAARNNVTFLENESVEIGNVRFLGCTLWTDFAATGDQHLAMLASESAFTDFQCIRLESWLRDGVVRPKDILYIHQQSVSWLEFELDKGFEGKTVVVTHFAPSPACQHPWFQMDHRSTFFLSDLEGLVEKADLWIFGHSHHCFDDEIKGTRVVANQRGYPAEGVTGFDPGFMVDV